MSFLLDKGFYLDNPLCKGLKDTYIVSICTEYGVHIESKWIDSHNVKIGVYAYKSGVHTC